MQVLLYGLGRPEVVTDFLVFFVFLESIFVLDRFEFVKRKMEQKAQEEAAEKQR